MWRPEYGVETRNKNLGTSIAGNSDRNVSVRLSVRHAPVLCQNEES